MNGKPLHETSGYRITDRFTVGETGFVLGRRDIDGPARFMVCQYSAAAPTVFSFEQYHDIFESALQDYSKRIEDAVILEFQRTGEAPLLPPRCAAIEPSTGQLINLQRGVHGYWGSDWSRSDDPQYNRQSADLINKRMGVTKAQEEAMLCGSMFGWDSKLADPRSYDEQGRLIAKDTSKKKGNHSHER